MKKISQHLKENIEKLPENPGVYLHKDQFGTIIYVGKAINLKNRVRQYFQSQKNMDPKVRAMVNNIDDFEYISCGSEVEALVLENNLIKEYMPQYNIALRDDKTYPYIRITNEKFPRLVKARKVKKDGSKYYGPFTELGAVNNMIELLNKTYSLKDCNRQTFPSGFRPCLNYHIGQCEGVCIGKISRQEYSKKIDSINNFFKGDKKEILSYLQENMDKASEELRYEDAAKYRDYIRSAKVLESKQHVQLIDKKDMDMILTSGKKHVILFFVRNGKLSGRETFNMQNENSDTSEEMVSAFIKQYYSRQTDGPSEILLTKHINDEELVQKFLYSLWEKNVKILVPERGEKRSLLDLAKRDVKVLENTIEERTDRKERREASINNALTNLMEKIGNSRFYDGGVPRVEAYDISNTNGIDTVGAMVVFEGMSPNKRAYRKFKVKNPNGSDDYGSMKEVLYRRFKRALDNDPSFLPFPDLIVMDGGKGHITSAREVLWALDLDIPVCGLAKDEAHRSSELIYYKDNDFISQDLRGEGKLFTYFGSMQEEVHRFVIEFHRGIRDGKSLNSRLDEIEGVGPTRRNRLLTEYYSIKEIANASVEDLEKVSGIPKKVAENIFKYFH